MKFTSFVTFMAFMAFSSAFSQEEGASIVKYLQWNGAVDPGFSVGIGADFVVWRAVAGVPDLGPGNTVAGPAVQQQFLSD